MPGHALIIDTETTIDEAQGLLFGAYRYLVRSDASWDCVAEGLIYADDLPDRDPAGFATLVDYARTRTASVQLGTTGPAEPDWRLGLLSRRDFVNQWWWHVGAAHNARTDPAVLVFFNAPFDISRLATNVGDARGDMHGGFSFTVWADEHGDAAPFRPRVAIKNLDSKRALKKNRAVERGKAHHNGHYLDLRTAVFALTGASHTLASACAAFEVPGKAPAPEFGVITTDAIDYCRQDVAATANLFAAVLTEYERHPTGLQLTQAYSPASVAKSYLAAMNITPALANGGPGHDTPPDVLGAAMSAFYGGRAECHIRNTPVPVILVDFTSMYPTVNALMGSWDLITADHIDLVDTTQETQEFLDSLTGDTMFDPAAWPRLLTLAQLVPSEDVLPVRAMYRDQEWCIGVNHLTDTRARWYTLGDIAASALLTGTPPRIERAITFTGVGHQDGLRPTQLRGDIPIDPRDGDFFTTVINQRQHRRATHGSDDPTAAFLKVLANAGGYGIYAEMIRREQPGTISLHTGHDDPRTQKVAHPEEPGRYCYPPLAACITGASRLMLALLEHQVVAVGGEWVFCDTDSMAIVATQDGGDLLACDGGTHTAPTGQPAITALSHAQVDQIRERFNQLNPYDQVLVPDLLKVEDEGTCVAISAKRYAIYDTTPGREIVITKRSEHGLGHYSNPDPSQPAKAWIDQTWTWIIRALTDPDTQLPEWASQTAVTRITISTPLLLRPFTTWNNDKAWDQQIKPANFLLVADVDQLSLTTDTDHTRFRLIAPFGPVTKKQQWTNLYDPTGPTYTTGDHHEPGHLGPVAKTYAHVIREYRCHPEHKFLDATGSPCRRGTRGILHRTHLTPDRHAIIGKEANTIEHVQAGLNHANNTINTYENGDDDHLRRIILPALAHLSGRELSHLLRCDRRTIDRVRDGQAPRTALRGALLELARDNKGPLGSDERKSTYYQL